MQNSTNVFTVVFNTGDAQFPQEMLTAGTYDQCVDYVAQVTEDEDSPFTLKNLQIHDYDLEALAEDYIKEHKEDLEVDYIKPFILEDVQKALSNQLRSIEIDTYETKSGVPVTLDLDKYIRQ